MSLVNRMLLDLEERQSDIHDEPALAGLSSVDYCASETRRFKFTSRILFTAVALVLLIPGILLVGSVPDTTQSALQGLPAEIAIVRPAEPPAVPETAPIPMPAPALVPQMSLQLDGTLLSLARLSTQETDSVVPQESPAPARMTAGPLTVASVEVLESAGTVDVNVDLTGAARFNLYPLVNPDRVVVEIPGATLAEGISRKFDSGLVQGIRARRERGVALLVLNLAGPARVQSSTMETLDEGARLHVQLAGNVQVSSPADFSKTESPPPPPGEAVVEHGQLTRSPVSADRLYEEGAEVCGKGNVTACLAKLTELTALDPGHVSGRQLLATTLLQHGDPVQAASVLDAGLQDFPRTWQWAQLRAQLAVNAGDPERAHGILTKSPPPLAEQPEYHALLAAVQQRTGRHDAAVNTYHGMLARQPTRSIWWMGLGISLQALARDREAGFAFRRALDDASLTRELRGFIQERMDSLAADASS